MSPWAQWSFAFGAPGTSGQLRAEIEDFAVTEQLGFEPDGEGEHLLLQLRCTNLNTDWVARQLARFYRRPRRDVGYSGRKDRRAVTTQWFSVRIPGIGASLPTPEIEGVMTLRAERSLRKLRPGAHKFNQFRVRIRRLSGDLDSCEQRLQDITALGFPNYFGPQRFGHDFSNLDKAKSWLLNACKVDRLQRGLMLSAARAWLFNQYLSARIDAASWASADLGELVMHDASHSVFPLESDCASSIKQRLDTLELHPTGPLWGERGMALVAPRPAELSVLNPADAELATALEKQRMKPQRRALRATAQQLVWQLDSKARVLEIGCRLAAGVFMTALLREVVECYVAES